jgi:Flp pilus assembly protein TadG
MALILPILILLVFGIIEFGHAFNLKQDLNASVREGARAASVGGDTSAIQSAVDNATGGNFKSGADITLTISPPQSGSTSPCGVAGVGNSVTVTGTVASTLPDASNYAISIPFFGTFDETYIATGVFRCETTGS